MNNKRNWTVLIIGGASGTGKSSIAYQLGEHYCVNVIEIDDIHQVMKKITSIEKFPAIHYWKTGVNWKEIGIDGNLNWLRNVSMEIFIGVKAIIDRHVIDNVPIIIEGDFIIPQITLSFINTDIKTLFIIESDKEQLLKNFQNREGGELQNYRADISVKYNEWLIKSCKELGIKYFDSRPWNTLLDRIISKI